MVRLPKIGYKSKSVPGNSRSPHPHDTVSAKAWFYCTPNSQFGMSCPNEGFKSGQKREIASITKVMTAICTL